MDIHIDKDKNQFYREKFEGNTEYKLRLDTKDNIGQKKILTQLLWRINEGYELYGEKIVNYIIGVYDDGTLGNLSVDEVINSINILKNIIKNHDNLCVENEEIRNINNSYIYYCNIKLENKEKILNEKKILVVGEQSSGKTTLVSQLCYNSNHKNYVLKHMHEKITGTTTDIKKEIIGISDDKIINYSDYGGWDEIMEYSDVILNIYDIPVTNIKVIINYLLGINPNFIFICAKNIDCPEIQFYIKYCSHYKILYKIIMDKEIINFDRDYFNKILIDVSHINNNEDMILETDSSIFRIIDYYDIPEKGLIVTGNQINNKFNEGDNAIIVTNNINYNISIKSIHKKKIKYNYIDKNESGSFLIKYNDSDYNNIKINKNSYIINKINKDNKYDKIYNIKCLQSIINNSELNNSELNNNKLYNITLFNANYSYELPNILLTDNIFTLDNKYYLQDKKILCIINNNISFDNIMFCLVE